MNGGAGDDTFHIQSGRGTVTIGDFGNGHDKIDLSKSGASSYAISYDHAAHKASITLFDESGHAMSSAVELTHAPAFISSSDIIF